MAKLTRKLLKQFASTAGAGEIDVFGSLAAGALATSTDPDTIQSLSQWLDGWAAEVLNNDSPVLEDRNAVDFVNSYMLKSIFQMGVPEWLTTETYYLGSLVNSAGVIYVSIADNQSGHAVTNVNYWKVLANGAKGLNPQANQVLAARAVATWTSEAASSTSGNWGPMCWSPELALFVAVTGAGITNRVTTSPDGVTWTGQAPAEANAWTDVCWSPENRILLAVSFAGTNRVMKSVDGVTWTAVTDAVMNAGNWDAVCWSPELGLFCAVGNAGQIATSPTGAVWTSRTSAENIVFQRIRWAAEISKFVALGSTGTLRIQYSSDGITWTGVAPPEANTWIGLCWSGDLGLFVALSSDGTNRIMTSRDGITWTAVAAPQANNWQSVDWSPELGLFSAVSADGTNRVMTSFDGVTWTVRAAAAVKTWISVCWSPQLGIFACGSSDAGTTSSAMMISKYVKKFIAA